MSTSRVAAIGRVVGAAATYCVPTLVLGWILGGQALTGRIDAWLVIPILMPGALLHARVTRGELWRNRAACAVAALVLLLTAQAVLHMFLAGRLGAAALHVTVFSGALCIATASLIDGRVVRWRGAARWSAYFLAAALWFGAAHAVIALWNRSCELEARPVVVMLTGLPLRWGAEPDFAAMLDRGPADHPALAALDRVVDLRLVDSLHDSLPSDARLFLAHPRALAPEEFVRIDAHVRAGGEAIILADALSSWPSPYPLGDPRSPPVTSLLTPLLDHWGVELAATKPTEHGTVPVQIARDGPLLRFHSAGRFVRLPPTCRAFLGGFAAECQIGAGTALIVGDADLLHESQWQSPVAWVPWLHRADTIAWLSTRLRGEAWASDYAPLWIRPRAN